MVRRHPCTASIGTWSSLHTGLCMCMCMCKMASWSVYAASHIPHTTYHSGEALATQHSHALPDTRASLTTQHSRAPSRAPQAHSCERRHRMWYMPTSLSSLSLAALPAHTTLCWEWAKQRAALPAPWLRTALRDLRRQARARMSSRRARRRSQEQCERTAPSCLSHIPYS